MKLLAFVTAEFVRQALVEIHNKKFHESPASGTEGVSCERTEGGTDITIITLASIDCFAAQYEHFGWRILYTHTYLN
jgi:hypothetical protein